MEAAGSTITVVDTGVVRNFLAVDRVVYLSRRPRFRFMVTDHIDHDINDHYPAFGTRLKDAIGQKHIDQVTVCEVAELEAFGILLSSRSFAVAECAAAAVAVARSRPFATDDRVAKKLLARHFPQLQFADTAGIMHDLIKAGTLTAEDANRHKEDWETNHGFRLPFSSFN